jgi:adenylate cyclase
MKLSRYSARRLQLLLIPTAAGICIGAIVASLISPKPTLQTVEQGMICGFLIGLSVFYVEYFVLDRLLRMSVWLIILSRTFIIVLAIVLSYIVSDLLVFGPGGLVADMDRFLVQAVLAALAAILGVMLIINVNRLLGQKAFIRLLVGKYHRPVTEKRIFMFIDLASSTALAEEMGDIAFHSFLNDFFFDATRPIVESKGEIYKYVGDEIIVTWKMRHGLYKAGCVECFFLIEEAVAALEARYRGKYGAVPRFAAGIHCGPVVIGEMGDYKREIAFLGDVVNTTSRIQSECRARSRGLIISDDLRNELALAGAAGYAFESLGVIALRGKKHEMELFSVSRQGGA